MESRALGAFPRALGTSITLPIEMLNAADSIRRSSQPNSARLKINIATIDGEPIELAGGIRLNPDSRLQDLESADLVMVPAMWGNPKPVLRKYPEIITWLKKQHEDTENRLASLSKE